MEIMWIISIKKKINRNISINMTILIINIVSMTVIVIEALEIAA